MNCTNVGFVRENDPQIAGSAPEQLCGNRVRLEADEPGGAVGDIGKWVPRVAKDESLNNNNKTFTMTAGTVWQLLAVRVELLTHVTGTTNRQIALEVLDSTNDLLFEVRAGVTQGNNASGSYNFGPSVGDLTTFRDTNWLSTPIPPTLIFDATSVLRVREIHNAHTNDDMMVYVNVAERVA